MHYWTDQELAVAMATLRGLPRGTTVTEARERIVAKIGVAVTESGLAHAFQYRGLQQPRVYIGVGDAEIPPVGPGRLKPKEARVYPPKTGPSVQKVRNVGAPEYRPTFRKAEEEQELDIPVQFDDADEPTAKHGRGNSSMPPPGPTKTDPAPPPSIPPPDPVQEARARHADRADRARNNDLVGRLRDAQDRQAVWDVISDAKDPPRVVRLERSSGLRDVCALALASDWHVEEPVDPVSVAGRNEYNLEIAEKRVDRYFQGIVWHIQHHRASKHLSIRHLLLWLGGDLYTGYIHPELIENNELSPTEAVRWLLPRLEGGIRAVLHELQLEQISIVCSFGNHGRTTDKMRVATSASNSFDLLLYLGLALPDN